jgi:MarR family transcriptional regulator, organic hydroperoxide resistance regulator
VTKRTDNLVDKSFALWRSAMRWQRTVNAALRPVDLTHSQYMILDATDRCIHEKNDAVMQREIAEAAGLDESTTSSIVVRLEGKALLDRGVSGPGYERAWRVLLSDRGKATLRRARPLVAAAAAEFHGRRRSGSE